ncbi:hypothetical protein [Methylibium petroleiphilum]|uniref:hypothetical protein n=1 Tax=Methylibium petroleiphilum TaxID=105560 RepID=UPI001AC09ADB|nr:hypothetical protein [Methylibium petroleiphilum]MBN9203042.1 hypothetical protein [Methylibium petroleiphilum]
MKTSQSELDFADTVPAVLAEVEAGTWFTGVRVGGASSVDTAALIHELDTSISLPTRARASEGFRDAPDPYGRRGYDRRYPVVTVVSALRRRRVVCTMATAAVLFGLVSLLVG